MDGQTSGQHPLRALSEAEVGKTRVHHGNRTPRTSLQIDQLTNTTEQNFGGLLLNGHSQIFEPENERDHGVATIQASAKLQRNHSPTNGRRGSSFRSNLCVIPRVQYAQYTYDATANVPRPVEK